MLTIYYIHVYTKKQAFLINIFTIFRISAYCTKIRAYLYYNIYKVFAALFALQCIHNNKSKPRKHKKGQPRYKAAPAPRFLTLHTNRVVPTKKPAQNYFTKKPGKKQERPSYCQSAPPAKYFTAPVTGLEVRSAARLKLSSSARSAFRR